MSEFIAIASPKGGVGKTTLATNMAVLLAKAGVDVLLVDINFASPDIAVHLSLADVPQTFTEVLGGHIPVAGAIYHHELGLKVLPAKQHSHSHLLFPKLHEHLPFLAEHADTIVVDFPPRADSRILNMLATFDKIIILSSNDNISQRRAAELESNLKMHNPGQIFHIINNVHPSATKLRVSRIPQAFEIPFDKEIQNSIQKGMPLAALNVPSHAIHRLKRTLRHIAGLPPASSMIGELLS